MEGYQTLMVGARSTTLQGVQTLREALLLSLPLLRGTLLPLPLLFLQTLREALLLCLPLLRGPLLPLLLLLQTLREAPILLLRYLQGPLLHLLQVLREAHLLFLPLR